MAQMQGLVVGRDQRLSLPLYCSPISCLQHVRLDAQQLGQGADIDDVLEQLALARIAIGRVADLRQRHADDGDVVAEFAISGIGREES